MSASYYLNDNSTKYSKTGDFNLSDRLYPENAKKLREIKQLEQHIKHIINAPDNAIVVFNSGASESIATCIHWAATINPYGLITGTPYDHSSVADNCKIYNLPYQQLNNFEDIDDRTAAIFLTHVSGKTGEILDVAKISSQLDNFVYLNENLHDDSFNLRFHKLLQYKPLVFLDVSQSIMKEKIDMSAWNVHAVFWSNHKLGGNYSSGVLVIKPSDYAFVPLIGGSQNQGLRGGSNSANFILSDAFIYDNFDDRRQRIKKWTKAFKYLTDRGLKVYKPTTSHLYNTLLISTNNKCPYNTLAYLSKQHVYLSPKSACMIEREANRKHPNEIMDFSDTTQAIVPWQQQANQYGLTGKQSLQTIMPGQQQNMQDDFSEKTTKITGINTGIYGTTQGLQGGSKHDDFANAVRLSFTTAEQLDDNALKLIADSIINN